MLEVKTFRAPTQEARHADLAEALEFARGHLAAPGEAPAGGTAGPAPLPAEPLRRPARPRPRPARRRPAAASPRPAAEHQPLTTPARRATAPALDAASTEDACCPS